MNKNLFTIALACGAFAVFLITSGFLSGDERGGPGTAVGEQAEPFSGQDSSGNSVAISDYDGKIIVVDFWASWCGPCVRKLPDMVEIQRDLGPEGVQVIGVNLDLSPGTLADFEEKKELNFPSINVGASQVAEYYGVTAIPTILVIDQEGIIQFRGHGGNIRGKVEALLEKSTNSSIDSGTGG